MRSLKIPVAGMAAMFAMAVAVAPVGADVESRDPIKPDQAHAP
jgi:hypothetical protein